MTRFQSDTKMIKKSCLIIKMIRQCLYRLDSHNFPRPSILYKIGQITGLGGAKFWWGGTFIK